MYKAKDCLISASMQTEAAKYTGDSTVSYSGFLIIVFNKNREFFGRPTNKLLVFKCPVSTEEVIFRPIRLESDHE
jgi:hypothetical protein